MPKYVFEVSVILPAGSFVGQLEADAISVYLEAHLQTWLWKTHAGVTLETSHEPPFEHVTGDWLPPDDAGSVKMSPSRPIDL